MGEKVEKCLEQTQTRGWDLMKGIFSARVRELGFILTSTCNGKAQGQGSPLQCMKMLPSQHLTHCSSNQLLRCPLSPPHYKRKGWWGERAEKANDSVQLSFWQWFSPKCSFSYGMIIFLHLSAISSKLRWRTRAIYTSWIRNMLMLNTVPLDLEKISIEMWEKR